MSCSSEEIHVGDIGTAMIVTLREHGEILDLAEFETITFTLTRPDGTACGGPGEILDAGAGRVQYLTVAGDLSMAGLWTVQVQVTNLLGAWTTSRGRFVVL